MKSLSPNAQEFIPVTVPITLNHLNHQTFSNQTNQSPIYVPVPSLPSNVHHHHHSPQPSLNQIQFQQVKFIFILLNIDLNTVCLPY